MSTKRYPSRFESRAGFFASTRDECLSPRVRLECNPEIPVAPGEEHWLLDTSLDEVAEEKNFMNFKDEKQFFLAYPFYYSACVCARVRVCVCTRARALGGANTISFLKVL